MYRRHPYLPAPLALLAIVVSCVSVTARATESPPSVSALNAAGIRALNAGDLSEALRDFLTAHQTEPNNTDVAFNLGFTYFRLGRYKEVVAPLRQVVANGEPPDKALYVLAVSLYEIRDFAGAITDLELLHRRNSGHQDEVLYLLVENYRLRKDRQLAKTTFVELQTRFPESPFLDMLMGVAYTEQGDADKALAEFRQAAAKNPSISGVYRAIGLNYLNRRDYTNAASSFAEELLLAPCDAASHYYLGEIARSQGQLANASYEYKKAVECDPEYGEGYLGLGVLLEQENQMPDAVNALREATRLLPNSVQAHYELGRCLHRAGNVREAEVEWSIAKRLSAEKNAKEGGKPQ